jgi:ATP-binding cassette subfamily D (ALD) long-chain fatty acid import protein
MYAYKDISELAGVTTRVYALLSSLHSLSPTKPITLTESSIGFKTSNVFINERRDDERGEDVLIKDLEFTLGRGEHLMITGTNGVGKSAVARVLKGLWEARAVGNQNAGVVSRPGDAASIAREDTKELRGVFFVPQRAYHVKGTLLDQ